MKIIKPRIICIVTLQVLFLTVAIAQTKAVTEYGDTIYIYDNGTWSFEELDESPVINEMSYMDTELDIKTIETKFSVPVNAKKQINNKNGMFQIKYNDKAWKRVPPATLNDEAEFAFESKKTDIWCVVISEETPIEVQNLFRIAKMTMDESSETPSEIVKTELRTVNGTEVLRGVLKTDFAGATFIFDTYYYSDERGSVQFTTWTSETIWNRTESDIVDLLNGFIVE